MISSKMGCCKLKSESELELELKLGTLRGKVGNGRLLSVYKKKEEKHKMNSGSFRQVELGTQVDFWGRWNF